MKVIGTKEYWGKARELLNKAFAPIKFMPEKHSAEYLKAFEDILTLIKEMPEYYSQETIIDNLYVHLDSITKRKI